MTLQIRTDRHTVTDNACRRLVLCTITAPSRSRAQRRPPVELAIALDRSGSMNGLKLSLAKEALLRAITSLDTQDRIGVITFDNHTALALEPTKGGASAAETATPIIQSITAGGGTNLHGGWHAASCLFQDAPDERTVRRCILITDGQANVGVSDADQLKAIAEHMREQRTSTSTFGIGADFDERTLSHIAEGGGGSFQYISGASEIGPVLKRELGEACAIIARDVTVTLELPDGVQCEVLGNWTHEHNGNSIVIELPDFGACQEVHLGLILDFPPNPGRSQLIGHLNWALETGPVSHGDLVEWQVGDAQHVAAEDADLSVVDRVMHIRAAAARLKALDMHQEGHLEQASRHLANLAQSMKAEYGDSQGVHEESIGMLRDSNMLRSVIPSDVAKSTRHRSWSITRRATGHGGTRKKAPPPDDEDDGKHSSRRRLSTQE